MSERKEKTPEQVSDEDYKVQSTCAAEAFEQEIGKHGLLAKTISFQRKRYENGKASRLIVNLNITLIVAISWIIYI
jgi:hypothetical protein